MITAPVNILRRGKRETPCGLNLLLLIVLLLLFLPTVVNADRDPRAFARNTQPGSDEQLRLIVQLRDEPIAAYLQRSPSPSAQPALAAVQRIRAYAETLTTQRSTALARIRQTGAQVQLNAQFSYLFNGLALTTSTREWQRIAQLPEVQAVYRDAQRHVTLQESVPLIGAPAAWKIVDSKGQALTGHGVRVAIIDSGVDYTHPDLGGGFGPNHKVIGGYDFVNNDADPMDDYGHGTHVAGIVAANGVLKGVAPDAQLLAYKACDQDGDCWDSWIIAALEQAADPDGNPATADAADVINLSLGGPGTPDDPLCQAVDRSVERGIIVVASAGNGDWDGAVESPGVARQAITVAATDKQDAIADFSSHGPVTDFLSVIKPDIAAPGVEIRSTVPRTGSLGHASRYRSLSGTSMAAPHVAGAAALIRQQHATWTPAQIKANLMNTAKDLGLPVYQQGAGRVQVAAATQTALLAEPGSIGFGLPLVGGITSTQLRLSNLGTVPLAATLTIQTLRAYDVHGQALATPVAVSYAQLNATSTTIAPGTSVAITVRLTVPVTAVEGYYSGKITARTSAATVTVPFSFVLLSNVPVRTLAVSPAQIPLTTTPTTIHLTGALRTSDGLPLVQAATPIAISINGRFAGYVQHVTQPSQGAIEFDWTFIPTDFTKTPGPICIELIFDLGANTQQEQQLVLMVGDKPTGLVYLPLMLSR